MSLDVTIKGPASLYTRRCPTCGTDHQVEEREEFFWANITHNLADMAKAADIYLVLWKPEELGATKAAQLIEPLREGLAKMKQHPDVYKQYNASNGWGKYEDFIPWIESYLAACIDHPDGEVFASR